MSDGGRTPDHEPDRDQEPVRDREPVRDHERVDEPEGRARTAKAPEAPEAPEPPEPPETPRVDLRSLLALRPTRGRLIAGLLCLVLGFAAAAQMESTRTETTFATARQDELVGILSDLSERAARLRGATRELEETKARLERDVQGEAAVEEARRRAEAYELLAGTIPATGPGIELVIDDPAGGVKANMLLDAVQELRDAGAEVIQVGDVRVGVNTFFLDTPGGGVSADGRRLALPYRFLVIGDPHTLTTALNIPGGVVKTLQGAGARPRIVQPERITVRAIRSS